MGEFKYARKRAYGRKKISTRKRYSKKGKTSAISIAKKALNVAKKSIMSATETKYLSRIVDSDVAGTATAICSAAIEEQLTSCDSSWNTMFGTDGVTGNKAYLKYLKGTWDIHMDNVNNEEETVNFTVVVFKPRTDWDNLSAPANWTFGNSQGIVYFDPRKVKVLYRRHFTLTMGGTSPGTAGESRKYGKFYIPINKMIRFASAATTGRQTTEPASQQDKVFFAVYTDNTAVDTESPRINYHMMQCWRDVDLNH